MPPSSETDFNPLTCGTCDKLLAHDIYGEATMSCPRCGTVTTRILIFSDQVDTTNLKPRYRDRNPASSDD